MRPGTGEVMHFSEDPTITEFVPHVARTAKEPNAFVRTVNTAHAPSYWFPRQCPRAMAWVTDRTAGADREHLLGPDVSRVHLIEYAWLEALLTARVFAYRFDAGDFEPYGSSVDPHAFVARKPVYPLGPAEPIGDLLTLHEDAGIQLRLTRSLYHRGRARRLRVAARRLSAAP